MNRNSILWCITVFFGASIAFGGLKAITQDSPKGVELAIQFAALAIMIVAVVLIMRKRK